MGGRGGITLAHSGASGARLPECVWVENAVGFGLVIGWYGFLAGAIFSIVLAVAGRRRSFAELTTQRIVKYSVASSVLYMGPPMISMLAGRDGGWRMDDSVYIGGGIALTIACSVATLVAARRADEGAGSRADVIANEGIGVLGSQIEGFATAPAVVKASVRR